MRFLKLKRLLKHTFMYDCNELLYRLKQRFFSKQELKRWIDNQFPLPVPHQYKQQIIKKYAEKYKLKTFVETGTYKGYMVRALKKCFEKIISIEIDEFLAKKANNYFRKNRNISILHGDSKYFLPKIVSELKGPSLFWLDAHYSGGITGKGEEDSPVFFEINTILSSPHHHVILLDDAADFNGHNGYPTIQELKTIVIERNNNLMFSVENNIIKIMASI